MIKEGNSVFSSVYDVDLDQMQDGRPKSKRRRNPSRSREYDSRVRFPLPFIIIIAVLIASNLFLWLMFSGISRQLNSINVALGQPESSVGTLLLGQEAMESLGLEKAPTEEDSIRQWEADNEGEEPPVQVSPGVRKVYLTFDDGPSKNTGEILDILDRYGVKATFFVVAEGKDKYKDMLKRIVNEGHTLGMHSYTHIYKEIYSSKEAFIKDINSLQDYIHNVTGTYTDYYRFPGGSSTGLGKAPVSQLKEYLEEIGVKWYDWNISSGDATGRLTADQIYNNSVSKLENYSEAVILFHDAAEKSTTVEALPRIIEYILDMEDTIIVPISQETDPVLHNS